MEAEMAWTEEHEKRIRADLAAARDFAREQGREPKTVVLSHADAAAALDEIERLTVELAARPPVALDALAERRRIEALAQERFEGTSTDSATWYRIRAFMLAMGPTDGPATAEDVVRDLESERRATSGPVAP